MRSAFLLLAASSILALATSCDGTISVTFATGPQELEVSVDTLMLPAELRDGAQIASVPCGPMGMCPPSDVVTLSCEAGLCDPAPKTITVPVGGVIDFGVLLAEAPEVGLRSVDSYEFVSVSYDVRVNTLTNPTSPIDVYWGPEAATAVDPALGVRRFGTVPAIAVGQTGVGQMAIDAAGTQELSDYLVGGGTRIRFFAQTTVDLEPGDPFPTGSIRVAVNATVRAVGGILD
jgi:hypothetical protein